MSLSCTLGIAVCLSYLGDRLTLEEVNIIGDNCIEAERSPAHTYLYNYDERGAIDLSSGFST